MAYNKKKSKKKTRKGSKGAKGVKTPYKGFVGQRKAYRITGKV